MSLNQTSGIKTYSHQYELIGGSVLSRRSAKVRLPVDKETYIIEVTVNEDEFGSYLNSVRGLIVSGTQGTGGLSADPSLSRPFTIGIGLMLAIGKDLGVGPRLRSPLRVVTLDGRHID